jgi:hypothetical protein
MVLPLWLAYRFGTVVREDSSLLNFNKLIWVAAERNFCRC